VVGGGRARAAGGWEGGGGGGFAVPARCHMRWMPYALCVLDAARVGCCMCWRGEGRVFAGRNSSLSGDRYIVADFIFTVYNGYVRKYN